MGRALLPICIHPSAAPGALQLGETHTGLPRPLGLWDKEGGACPRAPRFQELKYLCENGTWFHSSGRKTAQASGAGKGVLGHSVPQMAARPLWASFDKSIGLINLHQPSRIQASRRPGMATCHPPAPHCPGFPARNPHTPTSDRSSHMEGQECPQGTHLSCNQLIHTPYPQRALGRGRSQASCSHHSSLCLPSSPVPAPRTPPPAQHAFQALAPEPPLGHMGGSA